MVNTVRLITDGWWVVLSDDALGAWTRAQELVTSEHVWEFEPGICPAQVLTGDAVVQLLSHVQLFMTHGLQRSRFPRPSLLCPLSWWCRLTISSSAAPFSFCLQSIPSSEFFPMSQPFTYLSSSVAQSYLTLGDPKHCSPAGSSVRGSFQARTLEWVAIPFSIISVYSLLHFSVLLLSFKATQELELKL